jgi:hypothetical protein
MRAAVLLQRVVVDPAAAEEPPVEAAVAVAGVEDVGK